MRSDEGVSREAGRRGWGALPRRRVLTALATGAGVLLTAACGGATAVTGSVSAAASTTAARPATNATTASATSAVAATTQSSATGVAASASAASARPAAAGTATYLLQVSTGTELDQYRELAKRFTQQSGQPMEIAFATSGTALTKLETMVAGGDPPESTFLANWDMPNYATKGVLTPLDSLVARDKLDMNSFFAATVKLCHWTVNGADHLFALPRHPSPLALYYNSDLLKKQGTQPPDDTWTWDTLRQQAQKLTTPSTWGILAPYDIPYSLFPVVRSYGGDVLNSDWTKFTLDQSPGPETVQWIADLGTKQLGAPPFSSLKSPSDATLFNQGKAALELQIYPNIGTLQSVAKGAFAFDIARLPKGPNGRVNRNVAGTYTLINGAKHADTGWEWLRFLVTKESMLFLASAGIIIPALKAAAQDPQFLNPPAPAPQVNRQVFLQALEEDTQIPEPGTPVYSQITAAIAKALVPVWNGQQDAKTALQSVGGAVDGLLATASTAK